MNENQAVTNRIFLLNYDPNTGDITNQNNIETFVFNNIIDSKCLIKEALLYNLSGQLHEVITEIVMKENGSDSFLWGVNFKRTGFSI